MKTIRRLRLSDQSAFQEFQSALLTENQNGNGFVEVKEISDFPAFLAKLNRSEYQTDNPDWSTATHYYYFLNDVIVAKISCRWQIDKGDLLLYGGHIGFVTHPEYRRQGIMRELLVYALKQYSERAIEKVLITANVRNSPSRQTIENIGGVFENSLKVPDDYSQSRMAGQEIARYWVASKR
ncbi:GNAT family N-acetyltransferase [Streptococcus ictaluri]|nr:GNAT family N-acetyltransferase [Streptococcus ictaluri]